MTHTETLRLALRAMVVNNQAWKHLADSGDAGYWEAEEQGFYQLNEKAIKAVEAALEAKDEPVACWCHKCNENELVNGIPFAMTRMILCPNCGNKRCPKASDHTLQCTNSNEPNQAGSVHTTPPQRKPLTDEQIHQIFIANSVVVDNGNAYMVGGLRAVNIARAIEAAHGIK